MKGYMIFKLVCVLGILLPVTHVLAQDETKDKKNVRIELTYNKKNDETPIMKVSAKTKVGKRFESVEGVDVNIFFKDESSQGFIGKIKTNSKGAGSVSVPSRFKSELDTLPAFTFIATVIGDDRFEDESVELEIANARIDLTLEEEDSVRTMTAKVFAYEEGNWIEVPEVEIKFVVRRMLNDLRAGEDELYTTDESGEAGTVFELNIPGDANGTIVIAAKMEDNEMYGNLISTKEIKWGTPRVADTNFTERTLWATRDKTPWWLLIFPNLIITGVWGMIYYLLYQIFRIRKIGKAHENS